MKLKMKSVVMAVLMLGVAASAGHAESAGGNVAANAVGQILKMPFTLLHKIGESLPSATTNTAGKDVAVRDVYNSQDIEGYSVNPGGKDL